jgi:ribosome-binding factor A
MAHRIEQINELLKNKLAHLISREIPLDNGLITVVYVNTSPDLKYAKIAVSVLPEKFAGTALERLRKQGGFFSQIIRKETRLRKIPKFNWVLDTTEKEAAEIEEVFREIGKEK